MAELPAHSYNPLFLHGSPGIGKTHLLHAIGNYVERFGSGLKVRYATIEEFTSEFVEAVRVKSTADFKQRFRSADVVLIDDVQFLDGPCAYARGVLPHVQRAPGRRPAARDDLRLRPRGHPGAGGPPDRALPLGAGGRARHPRGRGPARDPRQAGPARRPRRGARGDRRDRRSRDHQRACPRGRADPRGGLRVTQGRARHAGTRPPRAAPARRGHRHRMPAASGRSSTPRHRSSGSNERRCWRAIAGRPSPPPGRSRCTSPASSRSTAFRR